MTPAVTVDLAVLRSSPRVDRSGVGENRDIHDPDLDTTVGSARLFAGARNPRVGLAKALGIHDRWGDSRLHQEVADSFGAPLRKLQIIGLRADIVGISVGINRISLNGHQDPGDTVQCVSVFRLDV
jgi:hypothetical protein